MPINNRKQWFLPKINVFLFLKKKRLRRLPDSGLASRLEGASGLHLDKKKAEQTKQSATLFILSEKRGHTGQTAVPRIA